tara:strand:- start:233 stop:451 length:219 start_codon:yes stop_codon:yes gene_type:complete
MTLLFNSVKDIASDWGSDGETKDVQTIAYQIKDKLSESGHFSLLKWLIPQLLSSETYGDEILILLEDVLKEH